MGLVKRTYTDGETVITAENLNDIQNAIIQNEDTLANLNAGNVAFNKESGYVSGTVGKYLQLLDSEDVQYTYGGEKELGTVGETLDYIVDNIAEIGEDVDDLEDAASELRNTLSNKADVIYDTASGDIATFPDGADGLPVKDLTISIEPVQDLHGYDSPWPAGGGANICDEVFESGTISSSGNNLSENTRIRTKNYIPCQPNTSYFYKGPTTIGMRYYNESKVHLGSSYNATIQANDVFTTPAGAYYLRFSVIDTTSYGNNIAINYPSSVTTYTPYSNICPISGWTGCNISHSGADTSDPDTITATWQDEAGTVYYGTIDIISGVLSSLGVIFDMGDLTYTETTSGIRFDITGGVGSGVQGTPAAFALCSAYKMYSDAIQNIAQITLPNSNIVQTTASGVRARFYIRDDRYTTPAEMKAGLAGVQFLCEMREPITYQLTPQQVDTRLGTNNIRADCGPVAVEYPADTKLYIQMINAPSDDDMTADTQIASGKYFIIGGTLYLSTTTIPAGDTIIPGTNCVQTNLAEALNALNA